MNPAAAFGGSLLALCLYLSSLGHALSSSSAKVFTPAQSPHGRPSAPSSRSPSAHAGIDVVVRAGDLVHFHGHGASPDQQIVEYSWDFDSDGVSDFVSAGSGDTTHIFTREGDYECLFRVRDSSGQTAQSIRLVKVVASSSNLPRPSRAPVPALYPQVNPKDGIIQRYAIVFNGGAEERYWVDVMLCYAMLTNRYGFSPADIHLLNYDGTANGTNPGGMIDFPATLANLQTAISNLATVADLDDEVFVCITDHGRGYSGSFSTDPYVFGYLDGRASVDPGDEPDYPESNFKLRSLMTGGSYISNHGMNVWKVFDSYYVGGHAFYRHKFVSHFDNLYIGSFGYSVSDNDVFIERLLDYVRGDFNRDGYVNASLGEVLDYDGDGVPPYNPSTGQFDEDDWGSIDELQDYDYINTQVPDGGYPYKVFDQGFQGKLCIDLGYTGGELHVDGRDEDGLGWFDWMDVNQDGDTNDVISIDEAICSIDGNIYDDDLRGMLAQLSVAKITVVAEPCFSGGLVDDLSSSNRVICAASTEDTVSWGDFFIRGFIAALHGLDEYDSLVNADSNGNGAVSMLEAFNYARANDPAAETPQYDDNGDGISHAGPVPSGGDGSFGADTYLSGGGATSNVVNEWTKPTSGSWEDPFWSRGQLPGRGQGMIAIRNAGWKAVAIARSTVVNHPEAVDLDSLTISAPSDSFNMLLLNYAGLDLPLVVDTDLVLSTNGSILSHYSCIRGGNLSIDSTATILDGSHVGFTNIVIGDVAPGQLSLTNSSIAAEKLILGTLGGVHQNGGLIETSELQLGAGSTFTMYGAASLTAPLIKVGPAAVLAVNAGTVSNAAMVVLASGGLRVDGFQRFGKLQVLEDTNSSSLESGATLYLGSWGASADPISEVHFKDSRDVPWSGAGLSIVGWTPDNDSPQADHVVVGTSSQALDSSQVTKVTFVDPIGWPRGRYPAKILGNGELVPAAPNLTVARHAGQLVLTWAGGYQLITSTNLSGPWLPLPAAVSPFTNDLASLQRFFRLAPQ